MRDLVLIALMLVAAVGFDEVRDEIRQIRWVYQFEHGEKTCNFAEVCPVVPNAPSHVSVQ